jgi:hypothetical protein
MSPCVGGSYESNEKIRGTTKLEEKSQNTREKLYSDMTI